MMHNEHSQFEYGCNRRNFLGAVGAALGGLALNAHGGESVADPANEINRTKPDVVVYAPKGNSDGDNEHFLVFKAPKSDELLAMWTQSSVEGHGDNRALLARSLDGEQWSDPIIIAGSGPGRKERQASWAFPIVANKGRIYCFYTKQLEVWDSSQASGAMGCAFSDDNGHTWEFGPDIAVPRTKYDNPDPKIPPNWIVWQKPIQDAQGRWIAGYTRTSSVKAVSKPGRNWCDIDTRSAFIRFDNIHEGPDPADIKLTWLPKDSDGLEVPHKLYPQISACQEPALVLLPDGRLFTVMRTMTGHIWYSVSDGNGLGKGRVFGLLRGRGVSPSETRISRMFPSAFPSQSRPIFRPKSRPFFSPLPSDNDGETWRKPEPLRYRNGGKMVENSLAPCPVYAMSDGRYLLVFNNNPGKRGAYDQFRKDLKGINQLSHLRNPSFIAVGEFRKDAHQPVWFSEPKKILDTNDVVFGPKRTASVAMYPSLTEHQGKRVLWYPDRKHFLLGKVLTDELLGSMKAP